MGSGVYERILERKDCKAVKCDGWEDIKSVQCIIIGIACKFSHLPIQTPTNLYKTHIRLDFSAKPDLKVE